MKNLSTYIRMEVAHMPDSTMLQSKDLQERYERYKEKIKHFTIIDNIFMRNVLKGTEEGVKQMCKELEEMSQFFRI